MAHGCPMDTALPAPQVQEQDQGQLLQEQHPPTPDTMHRCTAGDVQRAQEVKMLLES